MAEFRIAGIPSRNLKEAAQYLALRKWLRLCGGVESRTLAADDVMKRSKLWTLMVWLCVTAWAFLALESGAGLVVCHARDHVEVESLKDKAQCAFSGRTVLSDEHKTRKDLELSALTSRSCCGPCTDIPLSGNGLHSSQTCDRKQFTLQQSFFISLLFTYIPKNEHSSESARLLGTSFLVDPTLASIHTTILLI